MFLVRFDCLTDFDGADTFSSVLARFDFLTDFDVFDTGLILFGPCLCFWADFGVCGSLWPVSVFFDRF